MKRPDATCVIVGAGCAGLSLAVELVAQGLSAHQKIILLDARDAYTRDRTWSFWNVVPHRFESAVALRYSSWRVRDLESDVLRKTRDISYCSIPSDRFYNVALDVLRDAGPQVEVHLGTSVSSTQESADEVCLLTSKGEVSAEWVFDSRPAKAATASEHVHLLQHFVGHTVELDRPVFDPTTATLMDFRVSQEHGIHFIYVLPQSRTRALIESTFFTQNVLENEIYEHAISAYVTERLRARVLDTVEKERGVIPMTTQPFDAHPSKRVHRIGLAGGFAKPSTGYAFLAAQRYAVQAANAFRRGTLDKDIAVRDRRKIFLDSVFLSYLAQHAELGPRLFVQLFKEAPPDVLIRFLSETSSPLDELRVMRTLPTLPFAQEAFRSRGAWQRSLFEL